MKNLKLLAFCLMFLPFAAPMMFAAGSGQAQITLMPLAKANGNVISTSTSAPTISIVYGGSLTLTMTYTYNADYYVKEERTCTITIPFSNLTLAEGSNSETNILEGTLPQETLSYTADWSLTPQNQSYQVSINPSSGHASGSFDAAVSGTCTLGPLDHVVFDFLPQGTPEEGTFPVTITVTDNSQQPPSVYAYQYWVGYPFPNAVSALYDAENNDKIYSVTPFVSQHITFSGVLAEGAGLNYQYTGDLALTVESIQSAPLASVTGTSGIVEIFKAQEGTWENAVVGTDLENGDGVRTGSNSQAKVGFYEGNYLILGSDGSFTVEGVEEPTIWDLLKGKYYFLINVLRQWGKKFEVRTPTIVVADRGTEFTVEVAEDNATTVTVFEGMVDVQDRNSGSNATIATNQTLTVPNVPGGLTPQEMSALVTEVNPSSTYRWWGTSTPSTYSLTIESFAGGSTNPPSETYTQDAGATLTVTAYPNNNYTLNHWLLDGTNAGNSNPITITFNSDHTLQPVFTQGGPPSNRTVGVNQGDWAQYSVSWQTGAPSFLSDVTGIKVTVVEISGTTLTISTTKQFNNGTTTPSSPFTLDVNTGQGGTTTSLNMAVIASKLNQGDLVFTSPQSPLPNAQIADVTTWTQNGFNQTAVHFKSDTLGEYYWDRDTGILLYAEVSVYSGTSTPTVTATLTLTSTNRFSGGSVPGGLPISLLPLIAGAVAVVIGLIAAAVALRRHRGKKRASPPAETVKPKVTLATPPKAVEPGTPTLKKFAFCPDCGEKLPDLNAKFCPFCGARLDLQPETNAKTEGAETPKEAAPEGEVGTTSETDKKLGPLKNAAKIAKHGWKLKIVASLLIIVIAINTVYYFGGFNSTPALRPAQQIMDWIWSAPGLAQVHQALFQIVQGIQNLIPGGSNGGGVTLITPARDLTGTWVDLPGEGLVVTPLNGPHRFHYDATMDIVQHGSTFTGTMYISLWNAEALVPYSSWVDDGYWNFSYPGHVQTEEVTNGTISGVNIQFQVIGWTWKGTFTTDQMSGTVQGYSSGVHYSGVFTLRRGGGTTPGVPSASTGVEATASDGQVTISWGAVSGATSYNIYYSTTSGVTKTTGTKITGVTSPYTHTGLTNGMTYYYFVTAVNSSGESVESAHVSATPTGGSENLTGKIVFIASEEEAAHQRAVYVMDTDGSNLMQLTDYSIGAQDPVWSPDGKRIAFASIKDGGIYTINADGTNLTRIVYKTVYDVYTDTWNIAANEHPSWSPDGSMICYESYGDEDSGTTVANANIYVVNSDGTGMRRLTNDLSYEGQPSWSPDGSKIAFVYVKDEGDGYSNYHIYVMNADGSNWVQLTDRNFTVNNLNPDWSPNGTKIVFIGDGDEHQGVFCINLQDKSQKFIGVIGGSPKWSPDGTKIITDGYESRRGVMRIWITNADGSNNKEIETPMDAYEPDWTSHTTDIP
jgi:Tol biopolymer transport system component